MPEYSLLVQDSQKLTLALPTARKSRLTGLAEGTVAFLRAARQAAFRAGWARSMVHVPQGKRVTIRRQGEGASENALPTGVLYVS